MFPKKESIPSDEVLKTQNLQVFSVLEKYPHVAKKFKGLKCPTNSDDETLYVYNNSGKLIHEWDIDYFIQIFGLSHALDLINVIKNTTLPIYAWNRIWSKTKYGNLENINKIPFQDFDSINFDFVKKINQSIENNENTSLQCKYRNGILHKEIGIHSKFNKISLSYFYPNGNKKHLTHYIDGKHNDTYEIWHLNGKLKEIAEHVLNICKEKKCYYPTGNIKSYEKFDNDGKSISLKFWHENGQVSYENNEDGTRFEFSETGVLLSKGIRKGDIDKGGNITTWEYSSDGKIRKESKIYYIDGLLHGYEKSFWENGELRREVDFTKGHKNKIIKTYKKKKMAPNK